MIILLSQFRNFLSSGLFFYCLLAGAALLLVDRHKLIAHAAPSTLSRLRPEYSLLANQAIGTMPYNRRVFEDQIVYLTNVIRVMGPRADAFVLLGYCQQQLGDHDQAQKSFVRGLELDNSFFWAYHAQAVYALRQGKIKEASIYLETARLIPAEVVMRSMLTSRVLLPLLTEGKMTPEILYRRYAQGLGDIYKLTLLLQKAGSEQDLSGLKAFAQTIAIQVF